MDIEAAVGRAITLSLRHGVGYGVVTIGANQAIHHAVPESFIETPAGRRDIRIITPSFRAILNPDKSLSVINHECIADPQPVERTDNGGLYWGYPTQANNDRR